MFTDKYQGSLFQVKTRLYPVFLNKIENYRALSNFDTDNAWIEYTAVNYHDRYDVLSDARLNVRAFLVTKRTIDVQFMISHACSYALQGNLRQESATYLVRLDSGHYRTAQREQQDHNRPSERHT